MSKPDELDLVCIGGGPKGAAIAAKAHALRRVGAELRLAVYEANRPGHHWTGFGGYTSGLESLGTRPEKDVGFPYLSQREFPRDFRRIDDEMSKVSWQRHLIDVGLYRDWVDGDVDGTTHARFAAYLEWVFKRVKESVELIPELVLEVRRVDAQRWSIVSRELSGNVVTRFARSVVLTGPGQARPLNVASDVASLVLTANSPRARIVALGAQSSARVCIVGAGESAASAALALTRAHSHALTVEVIVPSRVFARTESLLENQAYSDPESIGWSSLSATERHEFIHRTDRGVISNSALKAMSADPRISFRSGRVVEVRSSNSGRPVVLLRNRGESREFTYDSVVNCTGFDPSASLRGLLSPDSGSELLRMTGASTISSGELSKRVGHDLALLGVEPRLYLPALAGHAQGPGFANLSSLGLMSDRVLSSVLRSRSQRGSQDAVARSTSKMGEDFALLH